MSKRVNAWSDEFVGPRYGAGLFLFLMAVAFGFDACLAPDPDDSGLAIFIVIAPITLGCAARRALRPDRLRLGLDGFDLFQTWIGHTRVRWEETEAPYLVTLRGRGRRTYQVVRCEFVDPQEGRRTITIPLGFGPSALALLDRMDAARAIARAEAAGTDIASARGARFPFDPFDIR